MVDGTIRDDFLELRDKADIYQLTGSVVERPLDEVNTPRGRTDIQLRIPPTDAEVDTRCSADGETRWPRQTRSLHWCASRSEACVRWRMGSAV